MPNLPKFSVWMGLAGTVIALDQATKAWVVARLYFGETVVVTSFFNLVYAENRGAAFSFLAGAGGWQRWFFVGLAVVISVWLLAMLRRHAAERLMPAALSLILGGAIGNVIDRLYLGAVVDFLDFHVAGRHWPAFNVADAAITVGVALMLWYELKGEGKGKRT